MIIYHPYSVTPETLSRYVETWTALSSISSQVIHKPCLAENDYEQGLLELWGKDDICIVEHDIVPTPEMIADLKRCSHPLCAQAYRLSVYNMVDDAFGQILPELRKLIASGIDIPAPWDKIIRLQIYLADTGEKAVIAHRKAVGDTWEWMNRGDEWADFAGFGLTKISLGFQKKHSPGWRPGTWRDLDSRFSNWVKELGYNWHIHWPEAKHNHL